MIVVTSSLHLVSDRIYLVIKFLCQSFTVSFVLMYGFFWEGIDITKKYHNGIWIPDLRVSSCGGDRNTVVRKYRRTVVGFIAVHSFILNARMEEKGKRGGRGKRDGKGRKWKTLG